MQQKKQYACNIMQYIISIIIYNRTLLMRSNIWHTLPISIYYNI